MCNIAHQTKTTMAKKEETKSIVLHIPVSIYYPMKDERDKRSRKGERILLHDMLINLIKSAYDTKVKK
jgi:hypothetical protein